jgi:3-methyl-2-oxobutanoate hydroxymethyltransferase
LTPQSVNQIGGYRLQGRTTQAAEQILADAVAIEEAGAFAIVLEEMPRALAKLVTERVSVPTIGIGAGAECDGQVQVWHDLLALYTRFVPRHVRQFAQLGDAAKEAITAYAAEVRAGTFPSTKESFGIEETVLAELLASMSSAFNPPA